jgi:hypothetical protein
MAKKKTSAAVIIPLALVAGGLVFAFTREAKADEPDVKPGPVPDVDDGDVNGDKRADVRPVDVFEPSATRCFRDGQPFNRRQWPDPAAVVAGLQSLGFPIGLVELLQSDAVARTPVFGATSGGYAAARSDKLKQFQAVARSLGLAGYTDAPASAVDGVIGECTLRSMSAAVDLQKQGRWPYEPTPVIAGMSIG